MRPAFSGTFFCYLEEKAFAFFRIRKSGDAADFFGDVAQLCGGAGMTMRGGRVLVWKVRHGWAVTRRRMRTRDLHTGERSLR